MELYTPRLHFCIGLTKFLLRSIKARIYVRSGVWADFYSISDYSLGLGIKLSDCAWSIRMMIRALLLSLNLPAIFMRWSTMTWERKLYFSSLPVCSISTGVRVSYLSRFTLTVIGLDIPGVKNKEPDQSFCPKIYPDPGLNNSQRVTLMANQKPWPTLVIEFGVSKSVANISSHQQLYLGSMYTSESPTTRARIGQKICGIVALPSET